jgi:hypothetical protein
MQAGREFIENPPVNGFSKEGVSLVESVALPFIDDCMFTVVRVHWCGVF